MSSREITLWLDERWYQALSRQLGDETVEDKLNNYLNELIDQLPEQVREEISGEIQKEEQQRRQEIEDSKRYSAFRVTEQGVTEHFRMEREASLLETAGYVRICLRQELGPRPFREMLRGREEITAAKFEQMELSRMEGGGKIAAVYDVDFDKGDFSSVSSDHGWVTYKLSDVSAAVWYADRCSSYDWNVRQSRLVEKLVGKEITPAILLSAENISLAEDMAPPVGPVM